MSEAAGGSLFPFRVGQAVETEDGEGIVVAVDEGGEHGDEMFPAGVKVEFAPGESSWYRVDDVRNRRV